MSKNKKKSNAKKSKKVAQPAQVKQEVLEQEQNLATEQQVVPVETKAEHPATTQNPKGKNKVVEVKAKDIEKKKNKDKPKKPNKVAKALKDTGNELKKVTWPSFKQVCKQTGIVMVVVIVFTLVLFGIDRLCSLLAGLLIG